MGVLGHLEVLDGAGHVRQRIAVREAPFSIGRGFGNDLVLDDPHVAAHHATLQCDAEGRWRLLDAGSLNGLRIDDRQVTSVLLEEPTLVVVGRTPLRFREAEQAVPPERALPEDDESVQRSLFLNRLQRWPVVAALALLLVLLEAGHSYFESSAETVGWEMGRAALELLGICAGWGLAWGLLSRLFTGRARFQLHLLIGLTGLLGLMIAAGFVYVAAFAFDLSWGAAITAVLAYVALGATVWLHLRAVTPTHRLACALASIGLALGLIGLDTGKQYYATGLLFAPTDRLEFLPASWRISRPETLDEFLQDAARLRSAVEPIKR
ncbi:MAG TPA: FHA domain-containing protein [Burkholderiaceae bacterium]|nr:FHA domain-containing protein [Burkholderiaceae bacterium]